MWLWDVDEEEDEFSCASVLQAHTQVSNVFRDRFPKLTIGIRLKDIYL